MIARSGRHGIAIHAFDRLMSHAGDSDEDDYEATRSTPQPRSPIPVAVPPTRSFGHAQLGLRPSLVTT
jgi:hypothetical protein